nr:sigma factor-like helix-turn-helix DNA-binding protein [Vagococcus allomyrinae]
MSQLSDRQRECYESVYLKGNTFDQTAKYLQISKGTVSTYIERADKKIQQYLKKRGVSDKRHLYSEGVINHE